jgi:hypothetical protein
MVEVIRVKISVIIGGGDSIAFGNVRLYSYSKLTGNIEAIAYKGFVFPSVFRPVKFIGHPWMEYFCDGLVSIWFFLSGNVSIEPYLLSKGQ